MTATTTAAATGQKSWIVALLLSFFLGALGVHRFYVGKIGTGVLMLVTIGGFGVWALIDFIMIAIGKFSDKQGLPLAR
ncbi:TM2 domain-containing protein [Paractinoplanes hotanensis]|uniref:TM2 domain-containing protein n=1 Tax=Paractinoplanes hotanensis TaxID=2906497 RepID=A0ABT0XYQ6_9ACTN|nr:TM2 domain-containing protein [Actinoplanes hotanensis]MCM4078332.1 TM2 domain-containing protein [Actinoplanes hotanensis]